MFYQACSFILIASFSVMPVLNDIVKKSYITERLRLWKIKEGSVLPDHVENERRMDGESFVAGV